MFKGCISKVWINKTTTIYTNFSFIFYHKQLIFAPWGSGGAWDAVIFVHGVVSGFLEAALEPWWWEFLDDACKPQQMKWKSTKDGNKFGVHGQFLGFHGHFLVVLYVVVFLCLHWCVCFSGMRNEKCVSQKRILNLWLMILVEWTFEENIPSLETCHFQKCFIVCTIRGWQGTQMSCLEDTSYIVVSNSAAVATHVVPCWDLKYHGCITEACTWFSSVAKAFWQKGGGWWDEWNFEGWFVVFWYTSILTTCRNWYELKVLDHLYNLILYPCIFPWLEQPAVFFEVAL